MTLRSIRLLVTLAAAAAAALPLARPRIEAVLTAQTRTPGVVAIRNATILTVTRGTIARGTVVLRDGRIAAVGPNVAVPAGAEVFEAEGMFVTP